MRSTDFLLERILNITDATTKQQYADVVWDVLQQSYKNAGGFKSAASVDELISKSGLWKLVTRQGKVTAVFIHRDQLGRKSIASGTNGTKQGLADYKMVRQEDVRLKRAWAEVSGKPEQMLQRLGCNPVPSRFARFLIDKEILDYSSDGFHYTRLIQGTPHEKVIYGNIYLDTETANRIEAAGIRLRLFPDNIHLPT